MSLDHLNAWRAVEAVMRTGSVAAAAEAIGVTSAAIAAQIRRLEDRLGRRLFDRRPGGLEPVPELLSQSARLRDGFAALSAAQDALFSRAAAQHVSLTTTQSFAENWLPYHLQDLFEKLGAIDLRLESSTELVDLERSDVHFAIRFMGEIGPGLEGVKLLPSGLVPVCTKGFAERYDLGPGRRDLSGVPLVHFNVASSDPEWVDWEGWSRKTGIKLGSAGLVPRYAHGGSVVRIARSGTALVLAGANGSMHNIAKGGLVFPFGPASVVPTTHWHKLIWRAGRSFGPLHRAFRDWLRENAAKDRALMARLFGKFFSDP